MDAPSLEIAEASYTSWVAGREAGGTGIDFTFVVTDLPSGVQLKEAFFKKNKAAIIPQGGLTGYVARFENKSTKGNVIMSSDPKEELQNTPPETLFPELPFALSDDQAAISYLYKDQLRYQKIEKVENKGMIAYPQVRQKP